MNRGAWWATVHEVTESDTTESLSRAHYSILLHIQQPHLLYPFPQYFGGHLASIRDEIKFAF